MTTFSNLFCAFDGDLGASVVDAREISGEMMNAFPSLFCMFDGHLGLSVVDVEWHCGKIGCTFSNLFYAFDGNLGASIVDGGEIVFSFFESGGGFCFGASDRGIDSDSEREFCCESTTDIREVRGIEFATFDPKRELCCESTLTDPCLPAAGDGQGVPVLANGRIRLDWDNVACDLGDFPWVSENLFPLKNGKGFFIRVLRFCLMQLELFVILCWL